MNAVYDRTFSMEFEIPFMLPSILPINSICLSSKLAECISTVPALLFTIKLLIIVSEPISLLYILTILIFLGFLIDICFHLGCHINAEFLFRSVTDINILFVYMEVFLLLYNNAICLALNVEGPN